MKKTGYHYTSWGCWQEIQKSRRINKYLIYREELEKYNCGSTNGIWIWIKKFKGLPHAGSIIFQMANKGETKAVLLKVIYDDDFILFSDKGLKVRIKHYGMMGSLKYHDGSETAVIYLKEIPMEDIKLMGVYNIIKIFKIENKHIEKKRYNKGGD